MNYSNLKSLIIAHEGIRSRVYKDTRGKRTIGVGFNMDQPGAQAQFVALFPKLSYTNVLNGLQMLDSDQIQQLLDHSIAIAVDDAKFLVPSFDAQPEPVQMVLIDMAFNMGRAVFSHFVKFLAAVESEHYAEAVAQLTNTSWRHEVGKRASDDIALLSTAANYRSFPEAGSVTPA
jgi:GH24 family phage-related lysozyme (muramidase)